MAKLSHLIRCPSYPISMVGWLILDSNILVAHTVLNINSTIQSGYHISFCTAKIYDAITEMIIVLTPHRGTYKHLLRHPHCRSIPVYICFVYQCIRGNKISLNLNLNVVDHQAKAWSSCPGFMGRTGHGLDRLVKCPTCPTKFWSFCHILWVFFSIPDLLCPIR